MKIPSCVKDTKNFFQRLEKVKDIPEESVLVTLDVKSSHAKVQNNERIKLVKESYEK